MEPRNILWRSERINILIETFWKRIWPLTLYRGRTLLKKCDKNDLDNLLYKYFEHPMVVNCLAQKSPVSKSKSQWEVKTLNENTHKKPFRETLTFQTNVLKIFSKSTGSFISINSTSKGQKFYSRFISSTFSLLLICREIHKKSLPNGTINEHLNRMIQLCNNMSRSFIISFFLLNIKKGNDEMTSICVILHYI